LNKTHSQFANGGRILRVWESKFEPLYYTYCSPLKCELFGEGLIDML